MTTIFMRNKMENDYSQFIKKMIDTDICFTWNQTYSAFDMLNEKEMSHQTLIWIEQKYTMLKHNCVSRQSYDGKMWHLLTIQNKDGGGRLCPMSSLLFGWNVSGCVYAFDNEYSRDCVFTLFTNFDTNATVEYNKKICKSIIETFEKKIDNYPGSGPTSR